MKRYEGTCYIGVVGPETEFGVARDSIEQIRRKPEDDRPVFIRATKGYEARDGHLRRWLDKSNHDFCLLLDHDMVFQPDTLERLRSHGLPYVSGYYMRRTYNPIAPVWFTYGPNNAWPMEPWTEEPERGKLHRLGASGWGCMLIHREVALAVREILKGEPLVIEDDMDIWPYDIASVLKAIEGLRTLTTESPSKSTLMPALEHHVGVLEEEIRLLRGHKDAVGSDLRFPFFARQVGYTLYGDPEVRPGHILFYPLDPNDYTSQPDKFRDDMKLYMKKRVRESRREFNKRRRELTA